MTKDHIDSYVRIELIEYWYNVNLELGILFNYIPLVYMLVFKFYVWHDLEATHSWSFHFSLPGGESQVS